MTGCVLLTATPCILPYIRIAQKSHFQRYISVFAPVVFEIIHLKYCIVLMAVKLAKNTFDKGNTIVKAD